MNRKKTGKIFDKKRLNKLLKVVIPVIATAAVLVALYFIVGSTPTEIKSRTIDLRLKDVGKLVTQEGFFRNLQSINDSRELFGITMPGTEKKYIYSYDGIVKAGIDFESISIDVDNNNYTINVYMPPAEIFDVSIDPNSFVVYHETNNTFNPLKLEDINSAQAALIDEVKEMALSNGMLEAARRNGEKLISGFIYGMGDFEEYEIVYLQVEKAND